MSVIPTEVPAKGSFWVELLEGSFLSVPSLTVSTSFFVRYEEFDILVRFHYLIPIEMCWPECNRFVLKGHSEMKTGCLSPSAVWKAREESI